MMKLMEWRQQRGLSRAELARRLRLSEMQVFRLETGRSRPRPKTMERIHRLTAGAVSVNDFYDLPPVAAGGERDAGDPLRRAGGGQG